MAIAVVQAVSIQATSGVTSITSPNFNSTNGNLVVANGTVFNGAPVATPYSDNGTSNTWAQAVADVADGTLNHFSQYYAKNINGKTGHNVTFSVNASTQCSVAVAEISGCDTAAPFDKNASRAAPAAELNPHSCGTTAATAQANEICVAGATSNGAASETFASNSSYIIQTSQVNTANVPIVLSTKIISSTGTQSEAYNMTADNSLYITGGIATYIAAAGVSDPFPAAYLKRDQQNTLIRM